MNLFNIFIIIFTIDVFIYIVEGIVFFTYARDKMSSNFSTIISEKLKNLGTNYYPNLKKTNTEKQNEMFKNSVSDENKLITSNQRYAIIYYIISIICLFGLIYIYLYIVIVKYNIEINFVYSIYIVVFVIFFIILFEILLITTVLPNYANNPIDFLLFTNNKILYYL
jgi:hypothetical protein